MNRLVTCIQTCMVIVVSMLQVCKADIFFGSNDSSIVATNGAVIDVMPTNDQLIVETGAIINQGFGTIQGKPIKFNRGVYSFFNSVSNVQAILEPNQNIVQLAKDPIDPTVDGGTMISNPGGLAGVKIDTLPGRNLLRGQPLFFGEQDLTLQDSVSSLSIAVQNTVNTNIILNGGLLQLQDDLRLGDNAVILDSGHVIFNKRRLSLGGSLSTWNGRILWDGAQDIQLNSAVNLNGEWVFFGNGQINGNGNVIDIANGGSIVVLEGSTLRLAGLQLKGLAGTGTIKLAPDATLILSDVVIEIENDYNIDSGTIFVEGSSTIITKDHLLSFVDGENGAVGKLIVDRVFLNYDTLASIDNLNIRPALINDPERRHVEILGKGEIGSLRRDTVTFHNYRSQPLLLKYAVVAPYRKFEVFPETDQDTMEQNFDVILDGNTNFMGFTRTDEQVFIVTENVHATTQNITLRDFSPKHVGFQPGASLVFGDQTTISLFRSEVLDYKWAFEGKTIVKGAGSIFEIGPNGAIELRGPNAELLLDGVTLKGIKGNNIRCLDNSCKIILKNVKWIQDGAFTYDTGAIDILDDTVMYGGINTVSGEQNEFIFKSVEPLKILSNATLSFIFNMIFTYDPFEGILLGNRLQLIDRSSVLFFNQATFNAVSNLQLSTGRFMVRDRNFVRGTLTFASDLLRDQPLGATLEQLL